MKAIRIHAYGGPEVLRLEELDRPTATTKEVVVRVRAAGVNPVDWKIRSGLARQFLDPPLPLILGCEIAGTVEALGTNVSGFAIGDEVFGLIGLWGGYSEYVALPPSLLVRTPAGLDFTQAAVVPMTAGTAWAGLVDAADLQAAQRVLIHGGAGGVGSMAIQVAHMLGAYVITTASAINRDKVLALGADRFIDYTTTRFETECGQVDVVFDLVGGSVTDRSWTVMKPGGKFVSVIMPPDQKAAKAAGVSATFITVGPNPAHLTKIGELIAAEKLRVAKPGVFRPEKVAEAHALSETGHARQRIALLMSD